MEHLPVTANGQGVDRNLGLSLLPEMLFIALLCSMPASALAYPSSGTEAASFCHSPAPPYCPLLGPRETPPCLLGEVCVHSDPAFPESRLEILSGKQRTLTYVTWGISPHRKVKTWPRSPRQHSPQMADSRKKGPGTQELEGSGPYCRAASRRPQGLLMVVHCPLGWAVHSLVVRSFWYC